MQFLYLSISPKSVSINHYLTQQISHQNHFPFQEDLTLFQRKQGKDKDKVRQYDYYSIKAFLDLIYSLTKPATVPEGRGSLPWRREGTVEVAIIT